MAANARMLIEVLGEPMRVSILERLLDGPATATSLAQQLPVTRSAISQHLQVMKSAELVEDTPVGTRRVYSVNSGALALLRDYFGAFWDRSLLRLQEAAESTAPPLTGRCAAHRAINDHQTDRRRPS